MKRLRDELQNLVTSIVPFFFVKRPEVIDVDHHDPDLLAGPFRFPNPLIQKLMQRR